MSGDILSLIVPLWIAAFGVWSWMVVAGEVRPPNWMRAKYWKPKRRK